MEETKIPYFKLASPDELNQLRKAFSLKYPNSKNVLGAQLGAFIRGQLENQDLKRRFGGLKNFVIKYFPTEISWRGRQGLDDLYDVCFIGNATPVVGEDWQAVPLEPTSWLWSSVTNPSTAVQFAWSTGSTRLMRSPIGVKLSDELIEVQKISKVDYQGIARNFASTMENDVRSRYLPAIEQSNIEFTTLIRKDGLLSKWEEFRVDSAVDLFSKRLSTAGADKSVANQWAELLKTSQRQARSQRNQKNILLPSTESPQQFDRQEGVTGIPGAKTVAIRAIDFLSEAELNELRLPLGSVMQAFRSLLTGKI